MRSRVNQIPSDFGRFGLDLAENAGMVASQDGLVFGEATAVSGYLGAPTVSRGSRMVCRHDGSGSTGGNAIIAARSSKMASDGRILCFA